MATTTRKTPIKYRRGKPMPLLRHGDVIDWTTFPLHSKPNGRPIEVCPKCGRKGERTIYSKTGAGIYGHTSRFETIWMMGIETCHIGKPDACPGCDHEWALHLAGCTVNEPERCACMASQPQ